MSQPNTYGGLPRPETSGEKRMPPAARGPRLEWTLIAVAVLLPLAIVGWRFLSSGKDSGGVIALEWPEGRRPGTTLHLDGVMQEVTPTGPLEYACLPGNVGIVVTPKVGPAFQRSVLVEAGQKTLVRIPWHEFDLTGSWSGGGVPRDAKSPPRPEIAANIAPPPGKAPAAGAPLVAKAPAETPPVRPVDNAPSFTEDGGIVYPTSNPNFRRVLSPVTVGQWKRWAAKTQSIHDLAVAPAKPGQPNAVTPAAQKGAKGQTAVPPSETSPKASGGL